MSLEWAVVVGFFVLSLPAWVWVIWVLVSAKDKYVVQAEDEEPEARRHYEPGLYHPREDDARDYVDDKRTTLLTEQFSPYATWDSPDWRFDAEQTREGDA